jgi:poly-gamma-glutamate capsule biosynthesis protein CapA/YwtB (metallophosphatase superfamily)
MITVIRSVITIWVISSIAFIFASCESASTPPQPKPSEEIQLEPAVEEPIIPKLPMAVEEEPEPYTTEASLIAVGDIMTHSPQIPAAYNADTQTYSFHSYFTEVKELLSSGDWVIGNLETPLGGEDLGYSGYPQFNAPAELADALKEAGFNILTTANNHAMDRREQGVLRTLENLNERSLLPVGTYASLEAAEEIVVVTKNEISMAILSYTYGVNGIEIPAGKEYLVNLIDEDKIAEDIRKARDQGVDLVTVALHMEGEYHRIPNEAQKVLTRRVIESGADIILGSHPHVVQPYEVIEVVDALRMPQKGVIIYSLGNFISNQGPDQGTAKYTDVGVIFKLNIKKHFPEGNIEISAIESTSTWVHKYWHEGKRHYRILPIDSVITAKDDPILTESQYHMLETYLQEMTEHIATYTLPADQPVSP